MRRILGILAGLVIAGIGTAILIGYVDDARAKAVAEESSVAVYVVDTVIPRSTPVPGLAAFVSLTDVPARLLAPGAVTDLASLDQNLVTGADLLPGEQLVAQRLTDPRLVTRAVVPDGLQEVTISLEAERALGGSLLVGDTVGVLASFTPPTPVPTAGGDDAATSTTTATTMPPTLTDVVLHGVLVTGVQFGSSDVEAVEGNIEGQDQVVTRAPSGRVLVTLAVTTANAAKLVYAAEFGSIWLTLEGPRASIEDAPRVDLSNIFGTTP
jgi:pilus assembly protein CpaB